MYELCWPRCVNRCVKHVLKVIKDVLKDVLKDALQLIADCSLIGEGSTKPEARLDRKLAPPCAAAHLAMRARQSCASHPTGSKSRMRAALRNTTTPMQGKLKPGLQRKRESPTWCQDRRWREYGHVRWMLRANAGADFS